MTTFLLLAASNIFMTIAWYWHLKGGMHKPLLHVIAISWAIAFVEYCFAVPANRIGRLVYSPAELKAMQEVITLVVFGVFSVTWLKSPITPNHMVGFTLIAAGAFFVFKGPL
jgi:uncharacterized protein (DUF486 family)